MPVDTHDTTTALSQLAGELADTIRPYEDCTRGQDDGLGDIADRLRAVHVAHAADLLTLVEGMGGRPEDTATMGAVRTAVRSADGAPERLGTFDMAHLVDRETRLVEAYGAAIAAARGQEEVLGMLRRQRDILRSQVDALRGA
jgi:hypothetical protein